MLRDRGDLLKYALADALMIAAKVVRGLRTGLTVSEREKVADDFLTFHFDYSVWHPLNLEEPQP